MTDRILEIAENGRHVSLSRGFVVIRDKDNVLGRVPLADISAMIISADQASISKHVLVALSAHNAVVIFCGPTYLPESITLPYCGNYEGAHRMRQQMTASRPLCKQLWKHLVQEKISNQARVLAWRGQHKASERLQAMKALVHSGDPENVEGQAARHYWANLYQPGFVRDKNAHDINILFNYCYTVLRSAVARSIVACGLLPVLGVHHRSRCNPYALADDLMEPYRPLADSVVIATHEELGETALVPPVKRCLASLLQVDMRTQRGISPLAEVLLGLVRSLAQSYECKKACLCFGEMLMPGARHARNIEWVQNNVDVRAV